MPEQTVQLRISTATADDAVAVADVRNAAADDLTARHGVGPWSGTITPEGVARGIHASRVLIAADHRGVVGTLRLTERRPWEIDLRCFEPVSRPVYLVDMSVVPGAQRRGVGRALVDAAIRTSAGWDRNAIRLDAYDHAAGAGAFYEKCGFRQVGRNIERAVPLIFYERRLEEAI